MRDTRYLLGYIVPLSVWISLYLRGWASFTALVVLFGLLPALELVFPPRHENHPPELETDIRSKALFDWLLYLNIPIQFGLLGYYLFLISHLELTAYEWIGMTLAMGFSCGVLGINVAHELGHRSKKSEQWMAQALLLTSLYQHFFVEHNRGHHKHVATPLDPATSRKGEWIYSFWLRSIRDSFVSAWKLEKDRLQKAGKTVWSVDNQMIRFLATELVFCLLILGIFSWKGLLGFLAVALIGILLLETVNYLEHYGLMRKELRPGVYERVLPEHSWNSDHPIGRIVLYELTRHSDHHFLASRKYQILRHHEESPQLPTGYPGMMLLSLVPPLWFSVMNNRLQQLKHDQA